MSTSIPLLKGTLDILVLRSLKWAPMHGFEITTWLEEGSHGSLGVEDSALYQALYRMEERELVVSEWGVTERNRKARYYRITPRGEAHLEKETAQWLRYSKAVTGILTSAVSAQRTTPRTREAK